VSPFRQGRYLGSTSCGSTGLARSVGVAA
jgi:hypothetical protein